MSRDPDDFDPDLPEGAQSVLDAEQQAELVAVLRAAWSPAALAPERHDLILDRALGKNAASSQELGASHRLRDALEQGSAHPAADLARALRAAAAPAELAPERGERILERALAAAPAAPAAQRRQPNKLVYIVFGAASAALALAAGTALVIRAAPPAEGLRTGAGALARSRSTAPLFTEKFSVEDSSERIQRIAVVRERELRSNRFTRWGVR